MGAAEEDVKDLAKMADINRQTILDLNKLVRGAIEENRDITHKRHSIHNIQPTGPRLREHRPKPVPVHAQDCSDISRVSNQSEAQGREGGDM